MNTVTSDGVGRRRALRLLGIGAALCPICVGSAPALAAAEKKGAAAAAHPHWGYSGAGAPEHWGQLAPENRVCGLGMEQTPIDLKSSIPADVAPVQPVFQEMPVKIVNNGHTVQVNCPPGSFTAIGGQRYDLVQFHFHHPSEHLLDGQSFPLECHFVHRSAGGALAVLGVFVRRGASNGALQPIFESMPDQEGPERAVGATIRPGDLLPKDRRFFRYQGSLTTPPCLEGLTWTVFRDAIEAADGQVQRFARLFPNNARPVQPLNGRYLLESR
jgi:carbonic anhydrase